MFSFKKIILLLLFLVIKIAVYSQCAMCKAVVESDLAAGGTAGKGLNEGILYLMAITYILMGKVGYFIYRHYKKSKLVEEV